MASIDNSEHGMPKQSGVANLIVKGAIALVTVAFFIGAYLQFQATFWMALIASLSVYIMLLLVHALMRRTERESDLVYEVNRLEDEVARLKVAPPAAFGTRERAAARICTPRSSQAPVCPNAADAAARQGRASDAAVCRQAATHFPWRAGRRPYQSPSPR